MTRHWLRARSLLSFVFGLLTVGRAGAQVPVSEADPPSASPELGACGDPATPIHAVQGSGRRTPLLGEQVVIEGVVVGDFQDTPINGFFVQEEDADTDDDPGTSEGLFVHEGSLEVALEAGDVVRVRGEVTEYKSLTELAKVEVRRCPQGGRASVTPLELPVDAVADLERHEGMLVRLDQELTVTESYRLGRYGSLDLSVNGKLYQPTQVAEPGAAAAAVADLNDRSRILLDDASTRQNPNPIPYLGEDGTRRLGDTLEGLTGILSGRFDSYRIQPTEEVTFVAENPRPEAPEEVAGDVRVASFNVLNFFVTLDRDANRCGPSHLGCRGADDAREYARQRAKVLEALALLDADILALNEIENDAGAASRALVDGLNARLGQGTYAFVDTGPLGGDAIKLAFLYKPAVVTPVGDFAVLDSRVDGRFVDTKNRPSLAQTFASRATGQRVTVVNNHLKSKGSPCDDVGDPDRRDGQGNCNGTRARAVRALIDWLAGDPTGSGSDRVLILGDLNAYAREDPITALKKAGYVSLVEAFVGAGAYSYVFDGEFGYLDHALASPSLAARVTGVTEWHINADEPMVLGYHTEYKTQDPFDPADPFRASDHDPLLVGIDMTPRCDGRVRTIFRPVGRRGGQPEGRTGSAGLVLRRRQ